MTVHQYLDGSQADIRGDDWETSGNSFDWLFAEEHQVVETIVAGARTSHV